VTAVAATMGCRMPHKSWDDRLTDLERALSDEKRQREKLQIDVKPLVDFYTAGTAIGKLLWIVGGIISGLLITWAAVSGWFSSHWK
jgi:hypothetical protein